MSVSRKVRNRIKSSLHDFFLLGQRAGVDILPRHFYSGIPDVGELRRTGSWRKPSGMAGVAGAGVESQLSFLRACCAPFRERLRSGGIHQSACTENGESGYGPVEADFLYCFIAAQRPARIVQIGAGVSTAVILAAAAEAKYTPRITCIDPFPTSYLKHLADRKSIELISEKVQEVDLARPTDIAAGDFFFVDSTHAVRPGSEVNRIVLEMLPRLPSGSFVHFHDIYFPYDHQADVLTTLFFASESSLLHAFLIGNSRYRIAVSLSMLHHACPGEMQKSLPNYLPAETPDGLYKDGTNGHFPTAIYMAVE